MHDWDTFAVVIGGAARALVGLLFVAISIRADIIAQSADLRSRAAQTLAIFALLLLVSVLLAIPGQPDRLLGGELLALAVLGGVLLTVLDRRGRTGSQPAGLSAAVKVITPSTTTPLGIAVAGVLIVCGVSWGAYLLVPSACIGIVGGLASAWLFLTKLTD